MAIEVSAFTALARAEFMQALIAIQGKVMPAKYDSFVTKIPSTVRVETHTFMSNLPRLREFKGYSPATRLVNTPYQISNLEYRIGPVSVRATDLADDQIGGYMMTINALPAQGQKDIGFKTLAKLAAGTTDLCFDGTAFFADSHVFGSGDNLMTANNASNDGVTHKIVALITDVPLKPILFQDRESLSGLDTDADTPQGRKQKEFEYWSDCRFGLGYGFWFSGVHLTITDTPTLTELDQHLTDICDRFRTFTLPKGADIDDSLYVHEGWVPDASNFTVCCNLGLAQRLDKLRTTDLVASGIGGAVVNNQYQNKFSLVPTSALGS